MANDTVEKSIKVTSPIIAVNIFFFILFSSFKVLDVLLLSVVSIVFDDFIFLLLFSSNQVVLTLTAALPPALMTLRVAKVEFFTFLPIVPPSSPRYL